ncbi:Histone-lysine N-methyltransferase ATX4 [Platanthera guangdongensis]|uniref:Histone-lysine N-methyltransferase ATX4 n=1 Tax=Platanthera guangdongensis TaxID=2320717 RepID=A0ABR2LMQ9_9ASPA
MLLWKAFTSFFKHRFFYPCINLCTVYLTCWFDVNLAEEYNPVDAKWTTERCAVCRWIEDWEYNKIIICIRCQVAVHQECYGVRGEHDFTSWICRACENPQLIRECCLCPVKGGALKPTDIDSLWVHITCAWFQPTVSFANDIKMEPAVGILNIPAQSFMKICVICKQMHGSCAQCCRCATYYHAMCASRAGYRMEVSSLLIEAVVFPIWILKNLVPFVLNHSTLC